MTLRQWTPRPLRKRATPPETTVSGTCTLAGWLGERCLIDSSEQRSSVAQPSESRRKLGRSASDRILLGRMVEVKELALMVTS